MRCSPTEARFSNPQLGRTVTTHQSSVRFEPYIQVNRLRFPPTKPRGILPTPDLT